MNLRIYVSTEALKDQGLTLQDFGVLLYYMGGGHGDIDSTIGNKLWEKNLLVKEIDGYAYNGCRNKEIMEWFEQGHVTHKESQRQFSELADKLRELYPRGSKQNSSGATNWSWRDNTLTIARKLKSLEEMCKENGIAPFTDEQAIEATKKYVESFNGDYTFMQLLKYFIFKNDLAKGEKTSKLLDIIQNPDVNIRENFVYDCGELV